MINEKSVQDVKGRLFCRFVYAGCVVF